MESCIFLRIKVDCTKVIRLSFFPPRLGLKGEWSVLRSNKAYLNCRTRRQSQEIWWTKLLGCGFFEHLPVETVGIDESFGRVTAYSVYARQSAPHYNSAAMDGIAVRAADTFGAQETSPRQLKIQPTRMPFSAGDCYIVCLLYTSPSPRDGLLSRMPSSA